MTAEPLDPAATMAAHHRHAFDNRVCIDKHGPNIGEPTCLPYRLAAALAAAQERAWDEGFTKAGRLLTGLDHEDWPPPPNPYRAALAGNPEETP